MRIRLISTYGIACGVATYAENLSRSLVAAGAAVEVEPIDLASVRGRSAEAVGRYYESLAERCAGADVVHVQHEHAFFGSNRNIAVLGWLVRRLSRQRVAVTFHTVEQAGRSPWHKFYLPRHQANFGWQRLARQLNRRGPMAAAVVAHTAEGCARLGDLGFAPGRIFHVEHALGDFRPGTAAAAAVPEGRKREGIELCCFGFLKETKGILEVIEALALLPPRFRLTVAGGLHPEDAQPILDRMARKVARLAPGAPDLIDRITVTGFLSQEEKEAAFARADIFVNDYHGEFFSMSGALSNVIGRGRPVVCSAIPSFLEFQARHGGLTLVPPRSPMALALKLLELEGQLAHGEPALARLLAEQAATCRALAWDTIARRHLEEVYRCRR
ncbi:MAG: glycosyltransferase [Verrucomicrobium sp.]|nr:glycosyltransferase [Verrucomicrobium sp.]